MLCIVFSNLAIAQSNTMFSFNRDSIRSEDVLTGYFFKLKNFNEKKCFNKNTIFLFKLTNRKDYLVNAIVISKNKCFSLKNPMVRFSFDLKEIFNDVSLSKGIYNTYVYLNDTSKGIDMDTAPYITLIK